MWAEVERLRRERYGEPRYDDLRMELVARTIRPGHPTGSHDPSPRPAGRLVTRTDRIGLALLAGGVGLALVNLVTWALGLSVGGVRPALSGALMAAGLVALAVGVVRGMRTDEDE